MCKIPKNAVEWQCTNCETWNAIEKGICGKCGYPSAQFAGAFQLKNQLTIEEVNFYTITAPAILSELRQIKELLRSNNGKG